MKHKAVALISGGLDSILAAKLMLDMGIEVFGINFIMPFDRPGSDTASRQDWATRSASSLGIPLQSVPLGLDYMEMVRRPLHGYGKAINPCVDCHIFFLKKAGEHMRSIGADFLVTGEVIGQRPMSQRRDSMMLIERESGYAGLVLRPLSARYFEPTIPEQNGWVDRDRLPGIKGRSRQSQFQLAAACGITEYPNPAGGCLLTELSFVPKVKDVFDHSSELEMRDFHLLKSGRHFRIGQHTKLILGRNEADNHNLEAAFQPNDTAICWMDGNTPLGLITGVQDQACLELAMRILLRYTKAGRDSACRIMVRHNNTQQTRTVTHDISENEVASYRID
ncbi:MAG TPA: hypothetical protein PLN25_07100 [Deltaproteobacteria bacterium]|nr:hypothetical protein [Deltaproteobacteria bacterium]